MFSLFTNIFRRAQTLFPAGTKLKKQSKRTEFIVPLYCLAVCCEVLRRWGWGRRWSRSSEEEPEASPVRRTTSTRTSRASCASLLRRLNTHTHTHTHRSEYAVLRLYLNTPPPPSCSLQERQSIIKYWMDNLRAKPGEVLHNINFLEGQPISKFITFAFIRTVFLGRPWYLSLLKKRAARWQALEVIPQLLWV